MAQYRLNIKIAHKGSIIQKASYNSRRLLHNDLTNKQSKNNWGHEKAEHWLAGDVELPEGVPEKYNDIELLWNMLAKLEKQKNGRVARSVEMNLPMELNSEQQIEMIKEFAAWVAYKYQMIFQWDIHQKEGNPHIHALSNMVPFDIEKKKFKQKWMKVYECKCKETGEKRFFNKVGDIKKWNKNHPNEQFERQPLLDKNGNQKYRLKKGKTKNTKDWLWVTQRIDNCWVTDKETGEKLYWNDKKLVFDWRKKWDEIGNRALEKAGFDARWTCESYKTLAKQQGLPEDLALRPTLHMGDKAFQLEQKEKARCEALGIKYEPCTRIGQMNQKIREENKQKKFVIREIKEGLKDTLKSKVGMLLFKKNLLKASPSLPRTLYSYYSSTLHCWVGRIEEISVRKLKKILAQQEANKFLARDEELFNGPSKLKPAYAGAENTTVEETRAAAPSHNSINSNKQASERSTKKKYDDLPPLNHDSLSSNKKAAGTPGGDSNGYGPR